MMKFIKQYFPRLSWVDRIIWPVLLVIAFAQLSQGEWVVGGLLFVLVFSQMLTEVFRQLAVDYQRWYHDAQDRLSKLSHEYEDLYIRYFDMKRGLSASKKGNPYA